MDLPNARRQELRVGFADWPRILFISWPEYRAYAQVNYRNPSAMDRALAHKCRRSVAAQQIRELKDIPELQGSGFGVTSTRESKVNCQTSRNSANAE